MGRVLLRVLFWLPIVLWLAVEIYLLTIMLINWKPGGDFPESAALVLFCGFPSSILVMLLAVLLSMMLPVKFSTGSISVILLWILLCVAGLIQWYYIMRGVESLLTRLYRWFRANVGDAAR